MREGKEAEKEVYEVDRIKGKVVDFLKKQKMDFEDIDVEANVKAFLEDMEKGLSGRESTLEMIPTYIETGGEIAVGESVVAIDAGGTNFRVARVRFDEQRRPIIEGMKTEMMPGVKEEVGKDEFFEVMAGYIRDMVERQESIGFCFSYPTEIFPNKDGRAILLCKEVKAKAVEGEIVGENLNLALRGMGGKGAKRIVILNDTVATLLAGKGSSDRLFGGYIGFILGTGTNCCYVEKNSNITKVSGLDPQKSQIINCESGGFGRFRRGRIDLEYDRTTVDPGVHVFEKLISGAYLGPISLRTIRKGCEEGLFSREVCRQVEKIHELETKELNDFMHYPFGDNPLAVICAGGQKADAAAMYFLVDRIVERAAKLTAVNLSSVAIKSDAGTDPSQPMCIVAEGTTFHHLKGLKTRVEYYLTEYLEKKRGIYTDIVSVENAAIIGAAIAGLTN